MEKTYYKKPQLPAKPNKTILSAVTVLALLLRDYLDDKSVQLDEEGLMAAIGAIGVILVYFQSNYKKLGNLG